MASWRCACAVALCVLITSGCAGGTLDMVGETGTDEDQPEWRTSTPNVSDELVPEDIDHQTVNRVRQAIDMGLLAGKALVSEGINTELARSGIDHEYIGGESMVEIPDDVVTSCPYVENAGNNGSTTISCRLLAERARDRAYVDEADTLTSLKLGPEFNEDRALHEMWLRNGLTSGIEGQFLMAVRRLREALVCDQTPSPVESSREQGIAIGREVFDEALEAQLAVTPITVCDIDNGIVNPALGAAQAQTEPTLEARPLCNGYTPEGMDDRAQFLQAQNEYRAGIRAGVEEGAIIASEQLFRTWVCQTPNIPVIDTAGIGDPLILDLDGDGVRISGPTRGVNFALGASALRRTGWLADPDDGFLAIDHDGNGSIDNGTELLGDMSWTADNINENNGLLSLARYDSSNMGGNGDGRIDARDAVFTALVVWRDRNLNGRTDSGELSSLADLSIESIALDYVTESGELRSEFELEDGTTRSAHDVWFRFL